jgi:hypothetical protein
MCRAPCASSARWRGLELWEQVELAAVVAAVVRPAHRDAEVGVVAAAERARHEVRRIDWALGADEA